MKILKCLILTSIFILITNELFASDNHWEYFGKGEEYKCIVETNENIWIGSRVGLIVYNKLSGQKKVHTRANSKLPSNYIISLASDKDDAIWIGTCGGGLVRYDGVAMEIYNTDNSMLPSNYVRFIDIDKKGKLWISTDEGLAKFDYPINTWTLMKTEIDIPFKIVYCSKIDTSGAIWISADTGLIRYKDSEWTIYNSTDENSFWITCDGGIHIDKNNQIWIGTGLGVLKYNCIKDTFELVNIPDNEGNNMLNYVTSIYEDSESYLWVTSLYAGLAKFDGQNWTLNTSANYKELKNLWSFHIDKNNNKWTVGGDNVFLMQDNETFNLVNIENFKLNSNRIRDIFVDKLGKAWILTYYDGINTYFNGNWESYTFENGNLPSNWARCICEDLDGGIWIGTSDLAEEHDGGGLMHIGKNGNVTTIKENDIESNHIQAIACDSKNRIWVATRSGIFVYNASNLEKITDIPKLNGDIRGICINSNDDIYIFDITNLLFAFKNNKWSSFVSLHNSNNEEEIGDLLSLSVDSKDTLYVLTEYGLWKSANNKWEKINKLNEVAPANLFWVYNNLFIDKNDVKWISSNHYGVIKNSGEDWQLINEHNSLIISNNVSKVFVDSENNEWYAFNRDGVAVKYSSSSNVDNPVLLHNIKLYPNPCIDECSLDFELPNLSNVEISAWDLQGNQISLIKSTVFEKGNYSEKLELSNYLSGIYFIKFKTTYQNIIIPLIISK